MNAGAVLLIVASIARAEDPATGAVITVDAGRPVRTHNRLRLLGTNVAGWNPKSVLASPETRRWIRELGPTYVRIPGGSWGDAWFWNGNGMRKADGTVDWTRTDSGGYPLIDYSGYDRAIMTNNDGTIRTDGWHGNSDTVDMHEFAKAAGRQAVVILNAGTGRAKDAVEWVKWARKRKYDVAYWEIGNELGGSWEAGNTRRDGTPLTGPAYAEIYREFATALKAASPGIKVGPCSFFEDVMRDAGNLVDFLVIHTYPVVNSDTEDTMFAKLAAVSREVGEMRDLVAKYQPARKRKIEIAYTEWNGPTGGGASDLKLALWSALWVGGMFSEGVDWALQWDAFGGDHDPANGFSLVKGDEHQVRLGQYWAFWLWRNWMGDTLLTSTVTGNGMLYSVATKSKDAVFVMAVNRNRDRETAARVDLAGFAPAARGELASLTLREFVWDPAARRVTHSPGPRVTPLAVGRSFDLVVPPLSIVVARIPARGRTVRVTAAPARPAPPRLTVLLPPEGYAEGEVEGWVRAWAGESSTPYPEPLPEAALTVAGGTADRPAARLAEAAGRFILRGSGPGTVTVTAVSGALTATGTIVLKPVIPLPRVLWDFEEEKLGGDYACDWTMSTDPTIRPNQRVVRVDFGGTAPEGEKRRTVLQIRRIPHNAGFERSAVRGAVIDLYRSADFACADPDAAIDVVMQSSDNWWMHLGAVKLSGIGREWKTHEFLIREEHIKAMGNLGNVWLLVRAKSPVFGALYLDRAGLLVR